MEISWDTNSSYNVRENRDEALLCLNQIHSLAEEKATVLLRHDTISTRPNITRHIHFYQAGGLEPSSTLQQLCHAMTRSNEEMQANRDVLHQVRHDIEIAFSPEVHNDFKNEFFSNLKAGSPLTKGALMRFLEKHNLANQLLPPLSTTAEITSSDLAEAQVINDGHHDTETIFTATLIEPPVIAEAINNPADPNFGHTGPTLDEELSVIDLDIQRN